PISHRIDHMLSGTKANIAIKLFGTDLNKLYSLGNEIKSSIESIEGVADLNVEQQVERPQLKITPKREMLAKYGITLPQFSDFVTVMLSGEVVSQVYRDGKSFDLTLKASDDYKDQADKIRNLMIDAGDKKIPFEYVAVITSSTGPNT
ncbi:efflux RND transporter permease subunit, partial [Enterobacter roggenkampii]|nr:efflux RND transporter permease subunit [Enterobacter roggenkampii]